MKPYLVKILKRVSTQTRMELRLIYLRHTGKRVPGDKNLRKHVPLHHAIQQGINAGEKPTKFYLKNVGLL